MSKNSKILIVTLLVLALIGGALFFTKPELFKGMFRFERQSVTPRSGTWRELKPDEPTEKDFDIKPDGSEKSITVPDLIL